MTLKYIGNGAHFPGIPATDLTDEQVEKHGGEAYLISTGLYKKAAVKKASKGKVKDAS